MSDPSRQRSEVPAVNSRAYQIVECKRRNIAPETLRALPFGFRGWNTRGYLPHRDEPGLTQFVSFRLADSLPVTSRSEWESLLSIESNEERRAALEADLDRGYGECWLRQAAIAELSEQALLHFHGQRYELRAWAIMPNHVHVLFHVDRIPMAKIVESWKKFIALRANWLVRRRGTFWQSDYWDTFMRDGGHEERTRIYIEENPVKAGLAEKPEDWQWSSARYRDENRALRL